MRKRKEIEARDLIPGRQYRIIIPGDVFRGYTSEYLYFTLKYSNRNGKICYGFSPEPDWVVSHMFGANPDGSLQGRVRIEEIKQC